MLWLGVHLPMLPLEVCSTADVPCHERGEVPAEAPPTVVVDTNGRVMLRNAAAAVTGITPSSTLATAHSIAAGLKHHRRDPSRERRRLELLAEALYGFSSRVSPCPPDAGKADAGIVMEVAGSLKLFGDVTELARRVAALCRDMGHETRVRWAATPLAALTLARADASRLGQVPLPQAAVEPERLSADRLERLANMGIRTVGQLLALPRQGVARRFGQDLVDYLARLTGERPDPRRCIQPPEHFRAPLHLLEPLSDKEALLFPMQRLLSDLQHWLVARQLGAERLCWHFTATGSGDTVRVPIRFTRAQQHRNAFLEITRLRLAETALPEEVIGLTLEAPRLVPWSAGSRNLFHQQPDRQSPAAGPDELGDLVDQLQARLGRRACHGLEVQDQHTPENAWSPTPPLARTGNRPQPETAPRSERKRPLWLFEPPRAVQRAELSLLRGPERLHTGWWSSPGQARDYYVARHRNGAECWVFVDPGERWFLHGYFA
ncbi:MAG: Y-family DNA polymerase [Pseudomonadota bacterium]